MSGRKCVLKCVGRSSKELWVSLLCGVAMLLWLAGRSSGEENHDGKEN